MKTADNESPRARCGLLRRTGVIIYDGLLLLSVFFFATLILLPFTDGRAIESDNISYHVYLLVISYLYFAWHWSHGGQTLGMRAWRVRLCREVGGTVNWSGATQRFLASLLSWLLLGCGFICSVFDPEYRTLHDRLTKTSLVVEDRRD